MSSIAVLEKLARSDDPKAALFKALGDLSGIEVLSGRVLVALYVAPEKMKSGIIRPTSQLKEDIYQSVVGLVVKLGNLAFKDDETHKFHGQTVNIGDWVVFPQGAAARRQIREVDCRIVEDTLIEMRVDNPELLTHR